MIPNQLTLDQIQAAFRDVYTKIAPLSVGSLDLNGRRIINSGAAVGDFDLMTKFDVSAAIAKVPQSTTTVQRETILTNISSVRIGTFATRGAAAAHAQEMFVASDHNYVGWVSNGAAWVYQSGENDAAQSGLAAIAAVLGTNDANYIVNVTDFTHRLRWTGSAWTFAYGDSGSLYFGDFPSTPPGGTWGLCDGSTYTYLKADGTTGSFVTSNLTGHYRKSVVAAADATVAAVAPGLSGSSASATTGITVSNHSSHTHEDVTDDGAAKLFTEDLIAGKSAKTGGPSATLTHTVNDSGHTHTKGTYAVDATAEPAVYKVLTFVRR